MIIIYNKLNLILLSLFFLQCTQPTKKVAAVKENLTNKVIVASCNYNNNIVSLVKEDSTLFLETKSLINNKIEYVKIDSSSIVRYESVDIKLNCGSSNFYLVFQETMLGALITTYHCFEMKNSTPHHTKSYIITSNKNEIAIIGKSENNIPFKNYSPLDTEEEYKEIYSFYGFQEYKEPTINNYYKLVKNNLDNKDSLNIICNSIVLNQIYDKEVECSTHNITEYNDIAYYLEQSGLYNEAAILLQKITKDFPDRTVAHLNLADAYWGLGNYKSAIKAYKIYAKQMNDKGKQTKVPKRVYQRMK